MYIVFGKYYRKYKQPILSRTQGQKKPSTPAWGGGDRRKRLLVLNWLEREISWVSNTAGVYLGYCLSDFPLLLNLTSYILFQMCVYNATAINKRQVEGIAESITTFFIVIDFFQLTDPKAQQLSSRGHWNQGSSCRKSLKTANLETQPRFSSQAESLCQPLP